MRVKKPPESPHPDASAEGSAPPSAVDHAGCIERVVLEPDPRTWPDLARQHAASVESGARMLFGRELSRWRDTTRRELRLPVDRLVLATGHQPGLQHPGILIKFMAVEALAQRVGPDRSAPLHLVVDEDEHDPAMIEIPTREASGALGTGEVSLGNPLPSDAPSAALACVEAGIERMRASLDRVRPVAAGRAERFAQAASDLMQPAIAPMPLVFASQLLRTSIGRALIEAMRDDPLRCATSYNAAVRACPESRVLPLEARGSQVELPIWVFDDARGKRRGFVDDLDDDDAVRDGRFTPRVLLMTGIMRLAVCDLFVHGTGGWVYDRITEQWLRDWLGVEIAPMTMATADVVLPLLNPDEESRSVSESIHALRRFRHDPTGAEEGISPSAEKRRYLLAMQGAPEPADRRRIFLDMHQRLEGLRSERSVTERRLVEGIERSKRLQRDRAIARRRDWPFPIYPSETIAALYDLVRPAFVE